MPFSFLIDTMQNNYRNVPQNTNNYDLTYRPECDVENLILEYPTYKGRGDYRLSVNGNSFSHGDIIYAIEHYLLSFPLNQRLDKAIELSNTLMDILISGLDTQVNPQFTIEFGNVTYNGRQFVQLVYWLIGQEEINYPRIRGKIGVRLPITRYHEAIVSVIYGFFNTDTVVQRAKIRNQRPPLCLNGIVNEQQYNQIDRVIIQNIQMI
ncbi:hypothetical protein [Peribacillus huizhouensis]|uniref:Uncharacterized protein n=1 Tax=Peribacillus huizhouensis TaxID=1501239 RepID=A0ABR6CRE5_9BACI|nr:hypothetical protein [Peribacillus huizhouensis]MBA9027604.1 hypothetical protein [Peribacillus huizhouensis]